MDTLIRIYQEIIKEYTIFLNNARELEDEGAARFWEQGINHLNMKLENL